MKKLNEAAYRGLAGYLTGHSISSGGRGGYAVGADLLTVRRSRGSTATTAQMVQHHMDVSAQQ